VAGRDDASSVLPAVALALPVAASLERLQSAAFREALADPSVAAARARGIPRGRLLWRHAWRLSLKPVLAIYGIIVGSVLSGSFAVEIVTSWPGLGALTFEALRARDLYLVAGCAAAGAAVPGRRHLRVRPRARRRRSAHRGSGVSRIAAALACGALALLALGAPWFAPHHPSSQFRDLAYAPPNPPRVIDQQGTFGRRSSIRCGSSIASSAATSRIARRRWRSAGASVRPPTRPRTSGCLLAGTRSAATC
jgi:hypothetical protein